jgi:uncharacterized protein (TIGR02118 family)
MKICFCLRRLPSLTPRQFSEYWLEVHAPLVRKHQAALRINRYVQLHSNIGAESRALQRFRDSPDPYDGLAEIWYESMEVFNSVARSAEARAANQELLEDERRFIDLARSPIWIGVESVIIGSPP